MSSMMSHSKGGTALGAAPLGLQDRLRKAAAMAAGQVRAHVRIPARPQPEGPHTSFLNTRAPSS